MAYHIPNYVIFGTLRREFILPASTPPQIDIPGGDLLYAAAGTALWGQHIGLAGQVGEDYPRRWLRDWEKRGFDTRGIHIQTGKMDLRWFRAYDAQGQPMSTPPMTAFAARHLPYPKDLLGYRHKSRYALTENADFIQFIPDDYLDAPAMHLCPLPETTQTHLLGLLKQGGEKTISLMFAPEDARPENLNGALNLIQSVTALVIREANLRQIFTRQTNDLNEMLDALMIQGGELVIVLRGQQGAALLDIPSRKRWQIPAYSSPLTDPTGYEDAFCGGFLSGFRTTYNSTDGVLYGLVAASLAQEGSGPDYLLDALPGLAQSRLDFLRTQIRRI